MKKQPLKCVLQKRCSGNFKQNSSKVSVIELISGKWVMSLAASVFFCFLIVQKKRAVTSHIFEYEIYHYTEASFLRKYYMLTSFQVKKVSLKALYRKWYSVENVPAISNILCSSYDILKKEKMTGFYTNPDISRTAMNF